MDDIKYQSGFGNEVASEAVPGTQRDASAHITVRWFALHWRACERGSSPSVARRAALARSSKSMQPEAAIGQPRPFALKLD
jgi:hypothetical protein